MKQIENNKQINKIHILYMFINAQQMDAQYITEYGR